MVLLSIYAIIHLSEEYFKNKGKELSKKAKLFLIWLVVLSIGIPYYFYSQKNGYDDSKQYYVNLFPKEDSQKNYRVPAWIYKDEDGIFLQSVDWSNGGNTDFDYANPVALEPYNKVLIEDNDNEEWYVELTHEQVK
jgi:hypothetical protein